MSPLGCFSIVFLNLPAKWRSDRIVKHIRASKHGFPCSIFRFEEESFCVATKGFGGPGESYAYSACHRLVEYRGGFYYFINAEAAFFFPPESLKLVSPADFKAFLESHTGLQFTRLDLGWNTSLRSILHTMKNTR